MGKQELPEVQSLFDRLTDCLADAVGFDGVVLRSADVRFANEDDFLSGAGAAMSGGRWNPPGQSAVYASLDTLTAVKESYYNFLESGFSAANIKPRVFAGATVKLQRMLDLTDARIRRRIGFSLTELVEEEWQSIQASGDESWTQAIGRGCRKVGFEGLIAPSARNRSGGKNLIIFPDRRLSGSTIAPLGKADLPPHPDHWPP